MRTLAITLFGICGLSGCTADPVRVACVGDSITFGMGIKDREKNSYPAQLGRILGDGFEVRNYGNSGSTMLKKGDKPYWKQREFAAAKAFRPDVVVIKLGTNDTKPQNWKHGGDFAADYRAMIAEFRALKPAPDIYLCLPVPVFKTRWGITDEVVNKDVIPAIRGVAKATGATLIDLNSPFEGKGGLVPDHVHPNAAGATIIAETVAEALAPAEAKK